METTAAPQPRAVEASQGATWISQGFDLFKKTPLLWIGMFVIWGLLYFVASILPLGGIVTGLLAYVFVGGWMLGCRSLDTGGELKVEHLFACFKSDQLTSLLVVGALYLAGVLVIVLVSGLLVGGSLLSLFFGKANVESIHFGFSLVIGCLLVIGLSVPLVMATWFAPALVVFHRQAPVDAMKQSFAGCMANIVPFLVYGLITLVLAMVAAIPFGLGFLVLGPVLIGSVYASYRDIFHG